MSGELLEGLSERIRNIDFYLSCLTKLNRRELLF